MNGANQPRMIVVSGPSGAGKTVLCRAVLERVPFLTYSISTTTRKPRGKEAEGEEYHFVPVATFRDMIGRGEFLEWAEVHGNFYGTPRRNLEEATRRNQVLLLNIDIVGASKLKAQNLASYFIFISPPSLDILELRLRRRGQDDEEALKRRLANARHEIETNRWYDFILVNNDFERAVADFENRLAVLFNQPQPSEFF